MSLHHSPKIVTDGLILYLDAANPKSYPGTGNYVYDLKHNASNITFYNTPVLTENSFDFISLDTDGLSIASTNYSGELTNFTMECIFKINSTHLHYNGALISSGNWNSSHWAFSINQNNTAIVTRNPSVTHSYNFNLNSWYNVIYRRNATTINFFINNIKSQDYTSSNNIPLTSDATNTAIGRETYASGYFNFNGKIPIIKIYNRALSDQEIQQNFNATRSRYGI